MPTAASRATTIRNMATDTTEAGPGYVESVVIDRACVRRCDVAGSDAKCGERMRRTGARMRQGECLPQTRTLPNLAVKCAIL